MSAPSQAAWGRYNSVPRPWEAWEVIMPEMDEQGRLLDAPIDAVQIGLIFDLRRGWHARVAWRRHGDGWGDEEAFCYDTLNPDELVDVVSAELWSLLVARRPRR